MDCPAVACIRRVLVAKAITASPQAGILHHCTLPTLVQAMRVWAIMVQNLSRYENGNFAVNAERTALGNRKARTDFIIYIER